MTGGRWQRLSNSLQCSAEREHRDWTAHLILTPTFPHSLWRRSDCHVCKMIPKDKASNLQFISAAGTGQTLETHTNTLPQPHKLQNTHTHHCFWWIWALENRSVKCHYHSDNPLPGLLRASEECGGMKGALFPHAHLAESPIEEVDFMRAYSILSWISSMKSHTMEPLKEVRLKLQITKAGPMEDGTHFQRPEYSK